LRVAPHPTQVFELRGEPDKYPGFLQSFESDTTDPQGWREVIAMRCAALGAKPFGSDYKPVPLEFNNEGRRKKNVVGDITLSMRPFIVFSAKARQALDTFISPVGEFLAVAAPVPGFIGYRVLKYLDDCIDLERFTCTKYENGNVVVRKATMFESKVRGHDIFAVSNVLGTLFVSDAFKTAVVSARLTGFDLSREVQLSAGNPSD